MEQKEIAKKMLPIIKAIADGKTIQIYNVYNDKEWETETGVNLKEICNDIIENLAEYRIKPDDEFKQENKLTESQKHYRPFKDCNELIEHYQKKYESAVGCDIYFPSLYKPCIWVRDKTEAAKGDIELITGFTEHGNVLLNGTSYPLQHLFQMYEFLDGSPCGVEE